MKIVLLVRAVLALILSTSLILPSASARAAEPAVWRVTPGGSTTAPCGGGWDQANPEPALRPCGLQTALTAARPGDELWVAEGTYLPSLRSDPADPRSATFTLPDGLAIYGGFAGTETAREQRDWTHHTSHLSGDLDQNDFQRPAPLWTAIQGANAYHVVDASTAAVLDGFTITGGDAGGTYTLPCGAACGGGVNVVSGSPTLANLTISGSRASSFGGGLFITGAGSTTLSGVTISGSRANDGGGLFAQDGAQLAFSRVSVLLNSAIGKGGGADFENVNITLEDGRFERNAAPNGGGLVVGGGGTTRINGALFANNNAKVNPGEGGALLIDRSALVTVTNATFSKNSANYGSLAALRTNALLLLTHITAVDNWANSDLKGGLIDAKTDSGFTIHDSIFQANGNIFSGSGFSSAMIAHSSLPACPAGVYCTSLLTEEIAYLGTYKNFPTTAGYPLRMVSQLIDRASCTDYIPADPVSILLVPLTRDQRGTARPSGVSCDLGAFEFAPRTLYVDASAGGANTGTSWADAFTDLQAALTDAVDGDQIWVAAGTYYPTSDPSDRAASFVLREEVAIYGGFAGNESELEQRDIRANETILSGDIDHSQPAPSGHSYHVVYSSTFGGPYIANNSILDGFTISGGMADGPLAPDGSAANRQGGGIYLRFGQPMLRNLVIRDNFAEQGGGMFNGDYAQIQNVLFLNNEAVYGGGLANGQGPVPNFSHSQPIMVNVTFAGNSADYGGAIANRSALPLYHPPELFQPDIVHATFKDNVARQAGSVIYATDSKQTIANSIIWGSGASGLFAGDATSSFIFFNSIVSGGCPAGATCTNVSGADPLLGALGSAGGSSATFPLGPNSPAIDAGAAEYCTRIYFTGTFTYERPPLTFDQRGAPRPAGGGCDLGAHEYQAELFILSGNNQRTDPGLTFPAPLVVGASSKWGDAVEGLVVHYSQLMSGGEGRISNYQPVITNGQAAVTATAGSGGSFPINGSGPGLNTITFRLYVNDTTVALTANPNPAALGQPVKLTATVSGRTFGFPPTPTGTVTFKDGAAILGTVTLPPAQPIGEPYAVAELTRSDFASGTHTLTAVYTPAELDDPPGDPIIIWTYRDITTSPALNLTVAGNSTAVFLSGLEQTYTGTPRSVTVTTVPANLPVRVTYDGSTQPPVKAGSYAVVAEINDPATTGSASGTLVISKAWLDVKAVNTSRFYGAPNPVFTHTITGFVNGETLSMVQGQPVLTCDATLSSNAGSYTIEIGPGTLQAENYQFRLSQNKLYVLKAATTTQITLPPGPYSYGQPVSLTITVARPLAGGPLPGGSLALSVDGVLVNTLPLVNGAAETVLPGLPAGGHTINAAYLPDGNHTASEHQQTVTIAKAATQLTLTVAPNPGAANKPLSLTATVRPVQSLPAGVTLTGMVVFTIEGLPPVSIPFGANGVAIYTLSGLPRGKYTLTALYAGDANFNGAASSQVLQVSNGNKLFLSLMTR